MRAVVAKSGACELHEDWPVPQAGNGEVIIRVTATAINRLDTIQRKGKAAPPPGASEVLGLEVAGEVVALGEGVSDGSSRTIQIGDEVLALAAGGGYAEFIAVPALTVMRKPEQLSMAHAASIPEAWLTAYQLVHTVARVQAGDVVLIHAAASGVGCAAIQLVLAAGATAIVTVGSAAKLELCVRLGALGGAIRHEGPWLDKVLPLSPKGTVNVVLDCVCAAYVEQNLAALSIDGRWLLYSVLSGGALDAALAPTLLPALLKKRISLLSTTLRGRPLVYKAELVAAFSRQVLPRIGVSGGFEHVIDRTFHGLGEAQAAHEYMESNANLGKIVLTVA